MHFIKHLPRILSFLSTTTQNEITTLLESKCNISSSTALLISNKLSKFRSPATPNSIIKLFEIFENSNFSIPNIASIITRQPRVLVLDPNKKLKVMLQYFQTIGLRPDTVASFPLILLANLHNRVIPNVELLRSLLPNNNDFKLTLKRAPGLLIKDLDKLLPPIDSMREYNVASNVISTLLVNLASRIVRVNYHRFGGAFEAIKDMDINPSSSIFAHAVVVLAQMPESEWEKKIDTYRQLGWSKDQVLAAFARHPYCMSLSDEKMVRNANFFEKLEWRADSLCVYPVLLSFSLEKRISPRYEIWRILASKGLVKVKPSERYFMLAHKEFTERYVVKYKHQAPEVLPIFKSMRKEVKYKHQAPEVLPIFKSMRKED